MIPSLDDAAVEAIQYRVVPALCDVERSTAVRHRKAHPLQDGHASVVRNGDVGVQELGQHHRVQQGVALRGTAEGGPAGVVIEGAVSRAPEVGFWTGCTGRRPDLPVTVGVENFGFRDAAVIVEMRVGTAVDVGARQRLHGHTSAVSWYVKDGVFSPARHVVREVFGMDRENGNGGVSRARSGVMAS